MPVHRLLLRAELLRMALSRSPEGEVEAMLDHSWRVTAALVGEDQLRRLLDEDRAFLAELN